MLFSSLKLNRSADYIVVSEGFLVLEIQMSILVNLFQFGLDGQKGDGFWEKWVSEQNA
jgi:hypothetical protein